MEEKVFRRPAVAGLLEERYVEARLHTDGMGAVYEEHERLQLEMTQSKAQPIYLVVDPETGAQYARHDGATLASDEPFIEFLNEGWGKRERHASTTPPR